MLKIIINPIKIICLLIYLDHKMYSIKTYPIITISIMKLIIFLIKLHKKDLCYLQKIITLILTKIQDFHIPIIKDFEINDLPKLNKKFKF